MPTTYFTQTMVELVWEHGMVSIYQDGERVNLTLKEIQEIADWVQEQCLGQEDCFPVEEEAD